MDPVKFDDLVRRTSRAGSRRTALGLLGAGLAATLGLAPRSPTQAQDVSGEAYGLCTFPGGNCSSDTQCCSHQCRDGACTCKKKGKRCFSAAGVVCCSRRCKKGRCK